MFRLLLCFAFLLAGLAQSLAQRPLLTRLTIRAIDNQTGQELAARYEVQALGAKLKRTGAGTQQTPFAIDLTQTDTLVVVTEAKGYAPIEQTMLISCDTCAVYEHTAHLKREDSVFTNLVVNESIRLDHVYFDQSSPVLRSESAEQLDKLARTLRVNPKLRIAITGHTDNVGDARLKQLLSEDRAGAVRRYLLRHAIEPRRLRAFGYGDARPTAPNDSEENKRKNRRVEFVVLEK